MAPLVRLNWSGFRSSGQARKLSRRCSFKRTRSSGTERSSSSCSASRQAILNSSVNDACISGALNSAPLSSSSRLRKLKMVSWWRMKSSSVLSHLSKTAKIARSSLTRVNWRSSQRQMHPIRKPSRNQSTWVKSTLKWRASLSVTLFSRCSVIYKSRRLDRALMSRISSKRRIRRSFAVLACLAAALTLRTSRDCSVRRASRNSERIGTARPRLLMHAGPVDRGVQPSKQVKWTNAFFCDIVWTTAMP